MNTGNFDLNSLLQNANPGNAINDAIQPLMTACIIFTVISIVLTVVIIVLWVFGMLRRRKVQAAIFDMQAILHEMNERDKARGNSSLQYGTITKVTDNSSMKDAA